MAFVTIAHAKLIQWLLFTNNSNTQTDLIIMYFAKAFDKVPHRRLLYELEYNGITWQSLTWISAFLSNRTQTVVIGGTTSNTVHVTSGTVLFLVYNNDLPDYLTYSKLRLFADDNIIYKPVRSHAGWLLQVEPSFTIIN